MCSLKTDFHIWLVPQLTLVEDSWITAERLLYSSGTRGSVAGDRVSCYVQPAGFSPLTHFAEMSPFYIVIEVVIAVLSISGNILVCWAVSINTTLKNATNYFLVSLAVADILVGCLAIPFAITISVGIRLDFYGCLFLACFLLVLTQSSIFSLLAIAIDRYLAVKIPLRYKELMTGKAAREIIAILWILSFVIGLIPFFGWNYKYSSCRSNSSAADNTTNADLVEGLTGGGNLLQSCRLRCFFESVVDMHYMVYFNFFVCVLLPLLIMLGIYLKIFTVARKQLRQIELKCVGNGDSHHHGLLQKEIRAAKSLSIIVGLFAICWLPVHILNCLTLFYKELYKPPLVMYVAIILSHANSAVNPIIYAYRIQDFRNTFRKILAQHFLCHREELYLSSNGSRHNRDQIHMTIDPLL
ncbi:adenosine receptor A2b isoform X1 [Epinephelus fuscoguttatus]|uniref:adenosine receptor A2b isoform X1 n=2 Tax=Epinephelus fuscoguttatus TaxID=293821 RepID=UPI0020D0D899|nr:adenosine receptor A2b isoform X1 [Epinephelus fuscoguttatus]